MYATATSIASQRRNDRESNWCTAAYSGDDPWGLGSVMAFLSQRSDAIAALQIPAIALTGFASIGDQAQSNAAGYQVHLSKPVVLSELTSHIARLVEEEK